MTTLSCDYCSGTISKRMYSCTSFCLVLGELLLVPSFWDCALCLCVLCMDGTWVVRVGVPSKIFKAPFPTLKVGYVDHLPFILSFILICVGLLLCFIYF